MAYLTPIQERVINFLRAFFFASDRDIRLTTGRTITLEDGTVVDTALAAQFVAMAASGSLANERVLTAGTGINIADGGAGGNATVSVPAVAAQFVTMALSGDLANERVLSDSASIVWTDGGAGSTVTGAVQEGAIDHGGLAGIADDDHTQYTRKDTLTTKGDIYVATGASTPDRLGVGANGEALLANSAQPTGTEWGTPGGNIPIGGIILWSGSIGSIPATWALCDGTAGTPNLQDRFVVGAGSSYAVGATGGQTTIDIQHSHSNGSLAGDAAGSHNHGNGTLDGDSAGAHTHGPGTLSTDSDSHTHGPGTLSTDSDSHSHTTGTLATSSEGHTHNTGTISIFSSGSHTHDSGTLSTDSDSHSHRNIAGADVQIGGGSPLSEHTDSQAHSHSVTGGATGSSNHTHNSGFITGATASDSHNHTVTGSTASDNHNHSVTTGATASDNHNHSVTTGATASDGAHTHNISGSTATESDHTHNISGSTANALSTTQDILPPYYALAYIQRVS